MLGGVGVVVGDAVAVAVVLGVVGRGVAVDAVVGVVGCCWSSLYT